MSDDRTPTRRGSDEHREKMRQAALDRYARKRARGESGRHANMVPPSYSGPRKHASDDPWRHSGLPGPTTLEETRSKGPTASELIEWRKQRTRKENT